MPATPDPLEIYKLRKQSLTWPQIAELTATTPTNARYHYSKLVHTIGDSMDCEVYANARTQLLNLAEERLLTSLLLDDDKLKAASLNNLSYSLQAVHGIRRLEQGASNVNIHMMSQVIGAAKTKLVQDLKQESEK